MSLDNILMIPHLSRELNLIGFPTLPYRLKTAFKLNTKTQTREESLKVIFDSKVMIVALTSVCFELVKQIKTLVMDDENNAFEKLNFENVKLQKQMKTSKLEIQKAVTKLAAARQENQQIKEKVKELENKVKIYKAEQHLMIKRSQTDKDILNHVLKKKETDLTKLHTVIWKQFNMVEQNYFPKNFEIIQLNQPDFSKLWSTVKYSEPTTKEDALKEAVCIFQKNNKALMEENFSLKMFLLSVLQKFQETFQLMVDKMLIPESVLLTYKNNDILNDVVKFNESAYNNILNRHLKIINKVCELFEETSFRVCDDLFVCWSNIIKGLTLLDHN